MASSCTSAKAVLAIGQALGKAATDGGLDLATVLIVGYSDSSGVLRPLITDVSTELLERLGPKITLLVVAAEQRLEPGVAQRLGASNGTLKLLRCETALEVALALWPPRLAPPGHGPGGDGGGKDDTKGSDGKDKKGEGDKDKGDKGEAEKGQGKGQDGNKASRIIPQELRDMCRAFAHAIEEKVKEVFVVTDTSVERLTEPVALLPLIEPMLHARKVSGVPCRHYAHVCLPLSFHTQALLVAKLVRSNLVSDRRSTASRLYSTIRPWST